MDQNKTIPAPLTQPAFLFEPAKAPGMNPLLRIGLYGAVLALVLLLVKRLLR